MKVKIDHLIIKIIQKLNFEQDVVLKEKLVFMLENLIKKEYKNFLKLDLIISKLNNLTQPNYNELIKFFKLRQETFRIDNDKIIYFFVISKCDYNCIFCDRPKLIRENFVFTKLYNIQKAIEYINFDLIEEIYIGGDEPFSNDNVFEILKEINALNKPITLLTSCSRPELIKKALSFENIKTINLPLYGLDAKTHEEITGIPGSYQNALDVIDYTKSLGKKLQIHTLIIRQNMHEINFKKNNIDFNFLLPNFNNSYDYYKKNGLSVLEIKNYFLKIIDNAKNYDLEKIIYKYIGIQPFCAFSDEIIDYLKNNLEEFSFNNIVFMDRKKVEKCKDCYFFDKCSGYYNVHFEVFGEEDVYPIK